MSRLTLPPRLIPYFQEYAVEELDLFQDANLFIQRTLEFGTWDDIRWLFSIYEVKRIKQFIRLHGYRMLKPVTFNYWRKLLDVRQCVIPISSTGTLWQR